MLPPALGNRGPRYRVAVTVPRGPRRVTDDGERPRFHIAAIGKATRPKRRSTPVDRCRKILVVKLDFIGDWALTTPFLENLRANAPRAHVTVVVLDRVFDLASLSPSVDRVISLSRGDRRRIVFSASSPATLADFRDDFLGRRFDLAIVPRWDADFNGALQIAFGSRAREVVGFSEACTPRKRRLNRGDDRFYTYAVVDRRTVHEADRDLRLIEALRGRITARRPTVNFSRSDMTAATRFLRVSFGDEDRRFLAVAPFGSEPKKTLPAERLGRVVKALAGAFGLDVVVIGSPANAREAKSFASGLAGSAASAAGVLASRQTAALLSRAVAFIGMDSGPAHIAAAVGVPVAALFCHPVTASPKHTYAPERFAPRGRPGQVLVIQPEAATLPCVEGCESGEAHCILALTEDILWPQLLPFVATAVGRTASAADHVAPVPAFG